MLSCELNELDTHYLANGLSFLRREIVLVVIFS